LPTLPTKPALSTLWRKNRFPNLADFFPAAENAGTNQFELDATVSLKEISRLNLPDSQIPSLEIPCPTHPKNFDARFASLDRYEREAVREAALSSLQLAADLQSQVVIVNMGRVDISPQLEESFRDAWRASSGQSQTVDDLRQEMIKTRAASAGRHLKAALYDIEYLANQAQNFGVKLGLLTPQRYLDFALPEEMQEILEAFGDPVYYWHDAGQAQIFDNAGLLPQNSWLDIFAEQTIGVHLYDTQGLRRFLPPQTEGEVDFAALAKQLPTDRLLTCKFSGRHEPEAVSAGLKALKSAFNLT
jgi:sugar phosphate isomerase/epimerase